MSLRITAASARRVLTQLRHDRRTVAMLLLIPLGLITLLWWIYDGGPIFDQIGAPLVGMFPLIVMFVVTSVATLRERTHGTLERLLTMPVSRLDFLLGYAIAFGIAATVQAVVVSWVVLGPLDLQLAGPGGLLVLVAVLDALLGVALGLFASAFARTEFQAVQLMPAIVFPQFLLCGLLVPRDEMPTVLSTISDFLPLSYAVDAMHEVTRNSNPDVAMSLAVVGGCVVAALALGAATLRRQTD